LSDDVLRLKCFPTNAVRCGVSAFTVLQKDITVKAVK